MAKLQGSFACALIFMTLVALAPGKKILIISMMMKSRVLQAAAIADGLIERGHEVHMVKDTKFKAPPLLKETGIRFIDYKSSGPREDLMFDSEELQKKLFEASFSDSFYQKAKIMLPMVFPMLREVCDLVQNKTLFAVLKDMKFDLAVLDATSRCLYLIPHNLGIPYVNYMPIMLTDMIAPALHAPILVPGVADRYYSEQTTLGARTRKVLLMGAFGPIFEYAAAYPSERPFTSLRDLADKAVLHLFDTAQVFDFPLPSSPNFINVGGLVTKPAKPLMDGPLKDFVESSENFILVTFGGIASHFPDSVVDELLLSLGKLKLKVVLQFNAENLKSHQKLPPNVYASGWLPQNDLLGHKKLKVFVTHCGNSGQHEALYHGVPMLGLPIFGDQEYNAQRFASKGFGLFINLGNLKADAFVSNITELLQNDSYKNAIGNASELYRDQLMTPRQTAAYWIDHVMKYGADHMMSYTNQLSWYQILMLDVIAVVLFLIMLLFALCYGGCRCCLWLCCRRRPGSNVKEKTS